MIRELCRIAVRGRRSREHDAAHFRLLRGEQDVQRGRDIRVMGGEGVARRMRHRRDGRVVQDEIHALRRAPAHLQPRRVAPDEPNAVAHGPQILATPGREVIQDGDLRAIAHQALDEMRADEPGAASDEVSHDGG